MVVCDKRSAPPCAKEADWMILAPDGLSFYSCDEHVAWLLYGKGENRVIQFHNEGNEGE